MINRFTEASPHASNTARRPAARAALARLAHGLSSNTVARKLLTTAQHTLTMFGISSLAVVALLTARPDLVRELSKILVDQPVVDNVQLVGSAPLFELMDAPAIPLPGLDQTKMVAAADEQKTAHVTRKEQQWVTSWLSKRYRVAGDAANMLVSTAYSTATEMKLDPLLILAVMAIESGLNPFAESPVGAQGLMQVMSKIHQEKFQEMGGLQAALNPVANIRVGSLILKDYVKRGGSVEAGLKSYVGAAAFDTDAGYGARVLAEYRRLKQVSAGKIVPTNSPVLMATTPAADKEAAPAALPKAPEKQEIAGL